MCVKEKNLNGTKKVDHGKGIKNIPEIKPKQNQKGRWKQRGREGGRERKKRGERKRDYDIIKSCEIQSKDFFQGHIEA